MDAEYVSPFMLHLTYSVGVIYMEMNQEMYREESSQAIHVLKQSLQILDRRWKAAGEHKIFRAAQKRMTDRT
jgi:hypothetical protein